MTYLAVYEANGFVGLGRDTRLAGQTEMQDALIELNLPVFHSGLTE